jgi:predicted nucleotidyltransferase component of viral defense system
MQSQESLKEFTKKFQTTQDNVNREYCQHLFLSYFYKFPRSERVLFKGGTALRLIYGSPRFSEDLDFSSFKISLAEMENIFANTLTNLEREGMKVNLEEAKTTSGGYLGIAYFYFYDYQVKIKIEISLRPKELIKGITTLIVSDYIPAYNVIHLPQEKVVQEKIRALLTRAKPRDFYDLYFLLRSNLISVEQKRILPKVLNKLESQRFNFQKELSSLLPKSHHLILKNFREILKDEIKRYL